METMQAIETRKSVRRYFDRPVEAEKLAAVIKTANLAPKAGVFHVTAITNRELLQEINDAALYYMKHLGADYMKQRAALEGYQPLYGAPVLALLSAPEGTFSQVTCACAATVMTVAATGLGLGSCYVVSPTHAFKVKPELLARLGLPEGYAPCCGVLLGYANGNAFSVVRAVSDNITYLE